jgi:hypothetical protein
MKSNLRPASSLLSPQSFLPSYRYARGIHRPLRQVASSILQRPETGCVGPARIEKEIHKEIYFCDRTYK